jgi:UDP-N-acetylmuramoyl-tripeptide--D-alanyl-D-alanine ligase
MGIDSPDAPKNMTYLLSIIKPNVGVVLNAGLTHTANFDYLVKDRNPETRKEKLIKLVAKEKMKLAKGLTGNGVAVVNIDQRELQAELRDVSARRITYGKSAKANLRILDTSVNKAGFHLSFSYQGTSYKLDVKDPLGEHYAYTFAAAIAVASSLGIPPSLSLKYLSQYRAPAGRMRIFAGLKNSHLLDSSYNASPDAVLESLKLLKKIGGKHKKIAVLGDMNELGLSSKIAHKQLADRVRLYCDEVILYGNQIKEYTLPVLVSHKFPVHHFSKMSELITYLQTQLKSDACVLFKGSQNGIFLERAVEAVLAEKGDKKDLCRRGKYWDKVRSLSL